MTEALARCNSLDAAEDSPAQAAAMTGAAHLWTRIESSNQIEVPPPLPDPV